MSQPDNPVITLEAIEVGGLRLPEFQAHKVGNVAVIFRRSRSSYIALSCIAPYRRADVVLPTANPPQVTVEELVPESIKKERRYILTGTTIDRVVRRMTVATTIEEIGEGLAPLVRWVRANFYVAP